MSVTIDKETFQRLTLLYLISRFDEGVYSSFRLQKVLYYATRDVEPKPFTFHHTRYGQYSRDASIELLHMFENDLLKRENLSGVYGGARWKTCETTAFERLCEAFEEGLPDHAAASRASVKEFGYMRQQELDKRVHADPILNKVPQGDILFKETVMDDGVPVALDDDTAEELEMMLSPEFRQAMVQLDTAVAEGRFDLSKVRTVSAHSAVLFNILLHDGFLNQGQDKHFVVIRSNSQNQLTVALNKLQYGPGSKHSLMRDVDDPEAHGNVRRMRVGNHRMVYRVYEQDRLIIPLFLSERPRNEATYRNWKRYRPRNFFRLR